MATKSIPLICRNNNNRRFAGFAVINQQLTTGCHQASDCNRGDGKKSSAHVVKPYRWISVQSGERQNAKNIYREIWIWWIVVASRASMGCHLSLMLPIHRQNQILYWLKSIQAAVCSLYWNHLTFSHLRALWERALDVWAYPNLIYAHCIFLL